MAMLSDPCLQLLPPSRAHRGTVSRMHTESRLGPGGMAKGAGGSAGGGRGSSEGRGPSARPFAREGAVWVSSAWGLHPGFPPHLLSQPGVPKAADLGQAPRCSYSLTCRCQWQPAELLPGWEAGTCPLPQAPKATCNKLASRGTRLQLSDGEIASASPGQMPFPQHQLAGVRPSPERKHLLSGPCGFTSFLLAEPRQPG